MKFRQTELGLEITSTYTNDLGNEKEISIVVNNEKINLAATSDLNKDGFEKLKRLIKIADAIVSDEISLKDL